MGAQLRSYLQQQPPGGSMTRIALVLVERCIDSLPGCHCRLVQPCKHQRGTTARANGTTRRTILVRALAAIVLYVAAVPNAAKASPQEHVTGRNYQQAITTPIGTVFKDKALRAALTDLANDRKVAIVIDRNVNTAQKVSASFQSKPLLTALAIIAAKGNAEVTALHNVVYIGPAAITRKLRTIVELRRTDAKKLAKRKTTLLKQQDIAWNTLTRPGKLFADMCRLYNLTVDNAQPLPHDLWHAARLPQVDTVTALTVVLAQFDLSFEWTHDGNAIRVVPMPGQVAIEANVSVNRELKANEIVAQARQRFPKAELKRSGRRIKVTARVEVIEIIKRIASGQDKAVGPVPVPMDQRLYSGLSVTAPAIKVIEALRGQGNVVEWDAKAFETAGIDLNKPVTVKADQTTAAELFKQICDPLGIEFRIEEFKVVLLIK